MTAYWVVWTSAVPATVPSCRVSRDILMVPVYDIRQAHEATPFVPLLKLSSAVNDPVYVGVTGVGWVVPPHANVAAASNTGQHRLTRAMPVFMGPINTETPGLN